MDPLGHTRRYPYASIASLVAPLRPINHEYAGLSFKQRADRAGGQSPPFSEFARAEVLDQRELLCHSMNPASRHRHALGGLETDRPVRFGDLCDGDPSTRGACQPKLRDWLRSHFNLGARAAQVQSTQSPIYQEISPERRLLRTDWRRNSSPEPTADRNYHDERVSITQSVFGSTNFVEPNLAGPKESAQAARIKLILTSIM
jgi:hypothetical protein